MNMKTTRWGRIVIMAGLLTVWPLAAQPLVVQHSFGPNPDGANPQGLTLSGNTFYGAAYSGGNASAGAIYKFADNGSNYANLFSFDYNNNGSSPNSLLVAGSVIYGTTQNGGTNGYGTLFSVGTDGNGFTLLRTFSASPDGEYPRSGLTLGGATLYGSTSGGGTNNQGTVFKVGTNGSNFTILWSFTNTPDGSAPRCSLLLNGATLYGTSYSGGTYGKGGVFKLNTNGGDFSMIYSFSNYPDAQFPESDLILYSNRLYGTTSSGGVLNYGCIFGLDTNGGGYSVLHYFTGPTTSLTNSDGAIPNSVLTATNGYLFGTAFGGGANNRGTVYLLRTDGSGFAVLRSFEGNPDGSNPRSPVYLLNGALWGTTYSGGNLDSGITFSLSLKPFFTLSPQNLTITNSNPASFTATASNLTGSLKYQWYFNTNTVLSGETNSFVNLATATTNQAGYYTVAASNSFGVTTSTPALLTVLTFSKPTITGQPQNLTVTNGNLASFAVAANGVGNLSYQWYFKTNTLLVGQNATNLIIVNASTNQAGVYSVTVSNSFGVTTSTPALLTVLVFPKPTISVGPQSLNVTNGNPASFSVTASGAGVLNYQWYFNTNTPLVGQIATNLSIANATTNDRGTYTVVVSNFVGAVTSSPANLTVYVPTKPVITAQPQSLNVTNGNPANFSVTASGDGALSYQWYFNTNTILVGQNATNLLIASTLTNNAGTYSVVVSNFVGSVTSSLAILTVSVSSLPIIVAQPQDQVVSFSNAANFSVTAVGQSPLTYQWYSNNIPTPGFGLAKRLTAKTNSTLTVTAQVTNLTYYVVVVSNSLGKATSSVAMLTVITAPLITSNPQPASVFSGDPASFTVGVLGASTLRYQWYFNTNTLLTNQLGNALVGRTNNTLAFSTASNGLIGRYSVIITNTYGKATSSPALLSVSSGTPPTITLNPLSLTITNGDAVTFNAAANGTNPLSYQWLFNTNVTLVGATNTTLSFATVNQPGTYAMLVTNIYGAATSTPAVLTVIGKPLMLTSGIDPVSSKFAFTFVNLAGSTNRLWATTNLAIDSAWQAIATNVMVTNGLWLFTDPNSVQTNALRLYRFSTP